MTPTPPDATTKATRRKCVIGEYCRTHGFVHGAEAEELRERLGKLNSSKVNAILDDVDARDSCAYVEVKRCRCPTTSEDDFEAGGVWYCAHCNQQITPPAADAAPLRTLRELAAQWHAMAKAALYEGAIPGDDGHAARWHAIDMCADELDALLPKETP